jgi:putative nucleotidyltransferase with HDIG domain
MGSFKPLLKIGNLTAVEHIIRSFRDASVTHIAIVTGKNAEELENSLKHSGVVFLRNDMYEHNEMFDSVKIGLIHCETLGMNYGEMLEIAQPYGCINSLFYENGCLSVESYGRMPLDIPDGEECGYLLKQFKTPDKVVAHCVAVSRKAVEIAESLNQNCKIDPELVRSAALLHDVARTEKTHDKAGFNYLIKCGYPRIANIVLSHHKLAPEDLETITESTIVFYADKLIYGTEEVTLDERFSKSRELCLTPEAQDSHKFQYDQARKAQDLINSFSNTGN